MLYVFLVDTGTMLMFDMNLALDDVAVLKRTIASIHSIPEDQQVLLCSGGTSLDPSMKVCNYGSGTDTCPIFLFSKCSIDSDTPPRPTICGSITDSNVARMQSKNFDAGQVKCSVLNCCCVHDNTILLRTMVDVIPKANMEENVDACLKMPNTYQSLVARVQLAQQFAELATNEKKICEKLVRDQRLQQQGWATVIANLEDSTHAFTQQAAYVEEVFLQYLKSRPTYQAVLQNVNSTINLLSKIPLLPSLLPEGETSEANTEIKQTLLDWLSSEPSSTLEHLANQCMRWLDQFNEETFLVLKADVQNVVTRVDNPGMKEIAGLGERLFGLDQLMGQADKVETDQIKQAQNLHQQQERVNNYNDMSVLPDLCTTHQHQLRIMLKNHRCLTDIRERCMNAKMELSANLHRRLRWILNTERLMYDVNNKLAIHRENLKRLSQHLEAIQQVHLAPTNYLKAAVEVCRRRIFSSNFSKWACNLAEQSSEVHKKEVNLRKTFNSQFSSNIVNALFPGMEDFPPPFATENPEPFDVHLPKIVPEDLEKLKSVLPEMANMIEIPVPDPMPQTCTTSDSAFSSEVPLSRITGRSTSTSLGTQPFRTENQESLSIGDYASAVNETTSLASSPFEDPTLPSTSMDVSGKHGKSPSRKKCDDSEVECKRLHLTDGIADKETFSPIEEEQNNVESDAEEFERVDDVPKPEEQFEDPCAINDAKNAGDLHPTSELRTRSESDCVKTLAVGTEPEPVFPKARSEGDIASPVEERLQSADSLLTFQDFQQTDYFIDDSMPSSYTESNGSALLKGNQMVKSHHIIVAELQHQLEEKNAVLASTQKVWKVADSKKSKQRKSIPVYTLNTKGKLKMSRSNILKLRRTITALQRYMQDVQEALKRDLLLLKEYVTTEKSIALGELAATMEEVKTVVAGIQTRIHSDKEDVVNEAVKRERENLEVILLKHQHKLEVEAQKLVDCQAEIDIYQEQIRQHQLVLDDLKQDADCKLEEFKRELCEEKDNIIKGMMLEHELEMENVKDQAKRKVQEKEDEMKELQEVLVQKEAQVQMLLSEKNNREAEQEEKLKKEQELLTKTLEVAFQQRQEAAVRWALEQQMEVNQEKIKKINKEQEELRNELQRQLTHNLEIEYEAKIRSFKLELEENLKQSLIEQELKCQREKECELQEMKETLGAQYKDEIESMRSRFKYAYSTTSMERMPSDSSLENLHLEKDVIHISNHEKALAQMHDKFETEKAEVIAKTIEAEREKSQETIIEAISVERQKHDNELIELTKKLQSEHEEQIERIKICHRAEKQVTFNEAINRATREKDVLIEELRARIIAMETQQSAMKSVLDQIMQDICNVSEELSSSSSDSVSDERTMIDRTMAEKLAEAIHRVKEVRNQIDQPASSVLAASTAAASDMPEKTIAELEMVPFCAKAWSKKEELAKLKMKHVKSVSGAFQDLSHLDKVSVLTCNVGDLVFLCYEEKHENYVVFYFGPIPHFLHTDSLELLNLKIPPEDPRKAWALVEVVSKQYCEAKKIGNRYKVPYGSRFYRVKVKPWDREAAVQRHNQQRLTSSISSDCPKPSTSGSSDDVPPKGGPMSSSTI